MTPSTCPVHRILVQVRDAIQANGLKHPKSRRIAEEILALVTDIALGSAGPTHLDTVQGLIAELGGGDGDGQDLAKSLAGQITEHREVFVSHVATRNCATRDCAMLAPAPCQMACPAGIDIPSYVTLIAQGQDDAAIATIRRDNPFPWVCGLVCTRPCELMCVRGRIDTPVSIKFLKAFAAERAMSDRTYRNPDKAPANGKKVCVIGAGPGGMSAAYYLALKGYGVTVIEAHPTAGGMLLLGIPRYRLPREVIDREVAMLEDLGVTFRFNTRLGTDVTFDQLKAEGFDAFFFAIGAHRCFNLNIPGEELFPQVITAIRLLRQVALGDRRVPGKRVIVVGGGNVAIDAARTCLRLGAEQVTIAYRRARSEMPADVEEVEQAEEEGVHLELLTVPVEIVGEGVRLTGLKCLRAKLIKAEGSDRLVPKPIEGSEFILEADTVVRAIGQRVDTDCLAAVEGLHWTKRNTLAVNMVTMETAISGIFAAGDAVTGPATVIEAIGGGKRAAQAIDRYLEGLPQPKLPPVPVRRGRIGWIEVPATTKMALRRPDMPLLNIDRRRTTFQQVELGYSENQVREEGRRCLRCDICLRCGRCVEICRDKMGVNALKMGYLDFDHPVTTDFRHTQEVCILCGACAANCPTGAMRIDDREGERILSLCGTILNRQKVLYCETCGAVLGPARYHEFIRGRIKGITKAGDRHTLCEACARQGAGRVGADNLPVA